MKFTRLFTTDEPIYSQIKWKTVNVEIKAADATVIFAMSDVEVPEHWSQDSTNILAQKYFRKSGVPVPTEPIARKREDGIPAWLGLASPLRTQSAITSSETSANQVFQRLSGHWTYTGWKEGYFDDEESAQIFYDETYYMLAMQYAAPNSPQWFNTGLYWAYGIEGPDTGQWRCAKDGTAYLVGNSYQYPAVHACFLTSVSDDLVNPGGIMDLWVREARIFKHGGGSGTNISNLRGPNESLSGGGIASGAMSFLKVGDAAAGAIASGGTTRRAAVMRCIDDDHPEIEKFITWKVREEAKAAAMWTGSKVIARGKLFDQSAEIPQAILDRESVGFEPEIYGIGWEEEAINTVGGQNSNNSVRVTNDFMDAVENNQSWPLLERVEPQKVSKVIKAKDLWNDICRSAWACADPGLIFHDTVNTWNTCAADGAIRTTNPCCEFHHLDDSACNLASLNLCKFHGRTGFWFAAFKHAVRIWTTVLDISVSMASFPSKEFAEGAYKYRTLGLGYANLGGLLHAMDLRYDSKIGRDVAAGITAIMNMEAYRTSNQIAKHLGAFPRYEANRASILSVIRKHRDNIGWYTSGYYQNEALDSYDNINFLKGFRNAQVTLIAPTGTIAIVMGCTDNGTTGIEPYFSKSSVKNLAGGGQMAFSHEVDDSDCAMPSYLGGPCLSPMAHVNMVAAVQPHLSGGVSKTVNLPREATVDDVSDIFWQAYKLGLKSIAIYRDGSKLSQPLNVTDNIKTPDHIHKTLSNEQYHYLEEYAPSKNEQESIKSQPVEDSRKDWEPPKHKYVGSREPLLAKRGGYTQKTRVGSNTLYLRTGEYPDGRLGEIFITLGNEGSTLRSALEGFAKAISIGIQYGVPLDEFVDAFINTKFEPAGIVQEHERIRLCSSIFDLIFRDLAVNYLRRDDLAHIAPVEQLEQVEKVSEILNSYQQTYRLAVKNVWRTQETDFVMMAKAEPSPKFSGEICSVCHNATVIQTGTCKTCKTCGNNSGCG